MFAYAPDGTVVLNPAFPAREGRAYHGEKDKKGKAFHDEILKVAQTRGSGWVDYWLPKPGQTEPSQKWSYVKAVKAEGGRRCWRRVLSRVTRARDVRFRG
jgi:cytochrome c